MTRLFIAAIAALALAACGPNPDVEVKPTFTPDGTPFLELWIEDLKNPQPAPKQHPQTLEDLMLPPEVN
ncbi:hypothetical protein SEA_SCOOBYDOOBYDOO_47 [Mycobacterium phage ScoobyDoobyDoo]|nr:hypothetical protein SEA_SCOOBYDOOBYDOO_47 [Mycobacterium phage ScoobyDoobyDoo]